MNHVISVDLGGTSLRLALLDENATFLKRKTLSSQKVQTPHNLVTVLIKEIKLLKANAKTKKLSVKSIALGIPGLVNPKTGRVYRSPHFPLWKDIPLVSKLKSHFDLPIYIDNDANQAALAEAHLGAGKDWQDFILLTLGTGIGGAIVSQKKIFHGSQGFAGEFGHMVIHPNGTSGALNIRGTLESYCSMTGLRLQILAQQTKLKAKQRSCSLDELDLNDTDFPLYLKEKAIAGDKEAIKIWQNFGKNLAYGLANLSHSLGIFKFILGGGLAEAWDLFIPACQKSLKHLVYDYTYPMIEIRPALLGIDAGLVGGLFIIK